MKNTPATNRSRPAAATERSGARTSSHTPKPSAPAAMARKLARPTTADESAPTSAPAPKTAISRPRACGPAWSVCFARIGSRMLKLKQRLANTTITPRTTCALGVRRT